MAQAVNTTKHLIAQHDARAYLAVVDCPAFLQAVADGSCSAVEEFHNDGVGRLNKVAFAQHLVWRWIQRATLILFAVGDS